MVVPLIPPSFAELAGPYYVEYADADVIGTTEEPPLDLLHRIHLVAVSSPGLVTVCKSDQGWRFLPGARLEPGESLEAAINRELTEEAGSKPVEDAHVFFSHVATSTAVSPYLPHAPHPVAWWSYAVVRTEVVGAPTCPAGGEQITELHHLEAMDAVRWLGQQNRAHAEVVRLGIHLGRL